MRRTLMCKIKKQIIDIGLVKSFMMSRGVDEKEMAELMSVSLPTIKRFLSGADQSHMSGVFLYKIAKALDISAHSLIHKNYR